MVEVDTVKEKPCKKCTLKAGVIQAFRIMLIKYSQGTQTWQDFGLVRLLLVT